MGYVKNQWSVAWNSGPRTYSIRYFDAVDSDYLSLKEAIVCADNFERIASRNAEMQTYLQWMR